MILKRYFDIFTVSVKKDILNFLLRYPVSVISSFIFFYSFFILIIVGSKGIPFLKDISQNLDYYTTALIGYLLWILFISTYTTYSGTLYEEAIVGTLEQLCMSKISLNSIIVIRGYARMVYNLILFIPLFFIGLFLFKVDLSINFTGLILTFLILPLATYIITMPLLSLSIIFKRLGNLITIYQVIVVGLIIPKYHFKNIYIKYAFPFLPVIDFLKQSLVRGVNLNIELLLIVLNLFVYYLMSLYVFKLSLKKAKINGTIGQY